jgi:hypothetical protein
MRLFKMHSDRRLAKVFVVDDDPGIAGPLNAIPESNPKPIVVPASHAIAMKSTETGFTCRVVDFDMGPLEAA